MIYVFLFMIVSLGMMLAIVLIPIMGITIIVSAIKGTNGVRSKHDQADSTPAVGSCEPAASTARYCDVCGTKFDERSSFCGNCGSQRVRASQMEEPLIAPPVPLVAPTPIPVPTPKEGVPSTTDNSKPEWYKSPITYIITGAVAVVAVLLVIFLPSDKAVPDQQYDESTELDRIQYAVCYKGKVANADIFMRLNMERDFIGGEYYYTRVKKPIMLSGSVEGDVYELFEYVDGENTGTFKMSLDDADGLSGTWSNGSKTFKVELYETDEEYHLDKFSGMNIDEIVKEGKRFFAQKDYPNAYSYFTAAAERGDNYSKIKVGSMYEYGQYVEKDYATAFRWFMKAASEGYAEAEYYVGDMYEYGKGVDKNLTLALEWYSKAAAQGNAEAQKRVDYLQSY